MANVNWEVVNNINTIHGVDFAEGLDLEGSFCYSAEITDGPAIIAIKNKVITEKINTKIRALIRKSCFKLEPFLFLRLTAEGNAYVLKVENNLSIYKLDLTDINSITSVAPIVSGETLIEEDVTYNVGFSCYKLIDGSTVLECEILKNNIWESEIKEVIPPDLETGDIGFGLFYRFGSITPDCVKSYFDKIEIFSPVDFI